MGMNGTQRPGMWACCLSSTLARVDRSFGILTSADPEKSGRSLQSWGQYAAAEGDLLCGKYYRLWWLGFRGGEGGQQGATAHHSICLGSLFLKYPNLTVPISCNIYKYIVEHVE